MLTYHEPQMKYCRNMKDASLILSAVCMGLIGSRPTYGSRPRPGRIIFISVHPCPSVVKSLTSYGQRIQHHAARRAGRGNEIPPHRHAVAAPGLGGDARKAPAVRAAIHARPA